MIDVREIWESGDYRTTSFTSTKVDSREKQVCNLFYDLLREAGVHEDYCETTMPAVTGNVFHRNGRLTSVLAFVRPGTVYFKIPVRDGKVDEGEFLDKLERLWDLRHHEHEGLNVELEQAEAGIEPKPAPANTESGCMSTDNK